MKKFIFAAVMASFSLVQLPSVASADVIIKVKPRIPVVKKVIVRQPCYYKTVKKYRGNKVTIVKQRVCP